MFTPEKYLFIQEYPHHRDIFNVTSFDEFKKKLSKLKSKLPESEYNRVSGFGFEFVIGVLLHHYGAVPQFGIMEYTPTYVGSFDNPDHGADGFGYAFTADRQNIRPAVVQIKYRGNKTDNIKAFGNLRGLVATKLAEQGPKSTINVTFVTNTVEHKGSANILAEQVDSSVFRISELFKSEFPREMRDRIYVRVIDNEQLSKFDNFHFWWLVRKCSGLFTPVDNMGF